MLSTGDWRARDCELGSSTAAESADVKIIYKEVWTKTGGRLKLLVKIEEEKAESCCAVVARFYILFSSKQYQEEGWFKVGVNLVSVH